MSPRDASRRDLATVTSDGMADKGIPFGCLRSAAMLALGRALPILLLESPCIPDDSRCDGES